MAASARHEGPLRTPLLQRLATMIREGPEPDFAFLAPGPPPWAPLAAPLPEVRVALVTTGGLHRRGDEPFHVLERPLGDPGFRVVEHGTSAAQLDLAAPYVDQKYTPRDVEVALPMQALQALHDEGLVGPPAARHASFVGGLVRPYPGLETSAEALRAMLEEDGAGAVVLLPTCSLCVQTAALVARELEGRGVPTVGLSLIPELSRIVGAPRTLTVHFPFGAPCGDPGNAALQRAVLREALGLLVEATEPGTLVESRLRWRR